MENFDGLSLAEIEEALTTRPGIEPPDGQVSLFKDPPTRNEVVIVVMTIGVSLAAVAVSLRLYSKIRVTKAFRLEDWIGLVSNAPYIGVIVMQAIITERVGFLVDEWNIHLGTYLDLIYYLFIYRIFYCLLMVFLKTAILLEWIHIFVPDRENNWFLWASRGMILVNVTAYILAIILTSVSCIPTSKAWQPWIDGHCFDRRITDILTAWVNLLMDLVVLILPQPIIWKLNMTRNRKIGVSLVFSAGLIVVACASGRIHSNMTLDYHGNTSHDASMNAIWAFGEATGVMIVFSAPGIPKAFSRETPLGRMALTLQSWIRLSENGASEGSNPKEGRLWPPTIGGSGGQKRKQTATELDLMETQNTDVVELAPDSQYILSNDEFRSREDYASGISTQRTFERQHPRVKN